MAKMGKKTQVNKKIDDYGVSTAPSGSRLMAYAIDWALGGVLTGFPAVLMYGAITKQSDMFSNLYVFEALGYNKIYGFLAGAICLIVAIAYFIVIPLKKFPGQTLGKKIAKVQIRTWDNNLPGTKDLLIRYGVNFVLETPMYIISTYLMQMLTLMIRFQVESVWTFVGIACTLISAAMVIYTKKHCAIHDCIAKTKVVEVKANETTN